MTSVIETNAINIDKVKIIISYLVDKVDKLYVTKLMKLLYYIDFISYAERGSSITNDVYYKLPYGPIPSLIKNEIDNLEQPVMETEIKSQLAGCIKLKKTEDKNGKLVEGINGKYNLRKLSNYELELINEVIKKLGSKTAIALTIKTHKEKPYLLTSRNSIINYELAKTLKGRQILSN